MPQPLAIWNSARDVWETPQTEGLFCEHLDVFSETFPTSGMTVNGVAYALPTWEPATDDSESLHLLGIPRCAEALTNRDIRDPQAVRDGDARARLEDQIALLPTPRASDGEKGGPNQRGSSGDWPLPAIAHLLPTPRAQHGEERNSNIYPRPLDQPQNLENSLARLPGVTTNPRSGDGKLDSEGQLRGQQNLLDALAGNA